MSKTKSNENIVSNKPSKKLNIINILLLSLFSLLIIITPFYRGLYFREQYIPTIAMIGVLFIFTILINVKEKNFRLVDNYIDIGALGLTIAYFISFLTGISKMDSLDGALKFAALFMVYKTANQLSKDNKVKSILLYVLVLTGFVTSLASMLGAAGIVKINGVFGWGERLNGLYQYPNATAAALSAAIILGLVLMIDMKNIYMKSAFSIFNSTMILAFLETRSRGAMLTFAFTWALSLLFLKGKDKLNLIMYSAIGALPAMLLYSKVYATFTGGTGFTGLFIMLVAFTAILTLVAGFAGKYIEKVSDSGANKVLIALMVIFVATSIYAFTATEPLVLSNVINNRSYEVYSVKPSAGYSIKLVSEGSKDEKSLQVTINSVDGSRGRTALASGQFSAKDNENIAIDFNTLDTTQFITIELSNLNAANPITVKDLAIVHKLSGNIVESIKLKYKLIPDDIARKISEISLKTESSSERMVFVKDGLKMFKDYPISGTGAKGWGLLYTKYQSYGYTSREAHNFYLQTAVESGIIGFVFLIAFLVISAYSVIKTFMKNTSGRNEIIAVAGFIVAIASHAALDFDISLYAIAIMLWVSLGILSRIASDNEVLLLKTKHYKVFNSAIGAVAVILVIVSSFMYFGILDGNKGSKIVNTDMVKAKKHYSSAMSKAFYNTAYIMDYSQILTREGQKASNKDYIKQVYDNYQLVEKNDPYKVLYYNTMLDFYFRNGFIEEGMGLIERLVDLQPLNQKNYELKANICHDIMNNFSTAQNYKEAIRFADMILDIENQYKEASKKTIAPFELTERTQSIITVTKSNKKTLEKRINNQ